MKTILLLHGALGTKNDLIALKEALSPDYHVHSINFGGHGGEPAQAGFSIEYFARQVLEWMEENELETIHLIGYSMGGMVGLYLALNHPEKIENLVTINTKLYWDPTIAAKAIARMNPDIIEQTAPGYAAHLQKTHGINNWKNVLNQTAALLKHLGQFNPLGLEVFRKIEPPVLLLLGDRDEMVTLVETTTVYKELSNGQFAVLPNTTHDIKKMDHLLVACLIKSFVGD